MYSPISVVGVGAVGLFWLQCTAVPISPIGQMLPPTDAPNITTSNASPGPPPAGPAAQSISLLEVPPMGLLPPIPDLAVDSLPNSTVNITGPPLAEKPFIFAEEIPPPKVSPLNASDTTAAQSQQALPQGDINLKMPLLTNMPNITQMTVPPASPADTDSTANDGVATDLGKVGDPTSGSLSVSGRWIVDASGRRFKLRCANWVGHMEAMIPEGLQHQTPQYIAGWVAKAGFNCIRLSYSTEMATHANTTVQQAFLNAANSTHVPNLTDVYESIKYRNPSLINDNTTVLDVYSTVIAALAQYNVQVLLSNAVSKPGWCCGMGDGNGWFKLPGTKPNSAADRDSRYFDVPSWLQGLSNVANFSRQHSNIVGMDLRNELRPTTHDTKNWYTYITQGANLVHSTNPDLLVVIGGLSYDTDLSFFHTKPPAKTKSTTTKSRRHTPTPAPAIVSRDTHDDSFNITAWAHKNVWEFHAYPWDFPDLFRSVKFTQSHSTPNNATNNTSPSTQHQQDVDQSAVAFAQNKQWQHDCTTLKGRLSSSATFLLLSSQSTFSGPLWLSEFGIPLTHPSAAQLAWLHCITAEFAEPLDVDWSIWQLSSSYYIRGGKLNTSDSFAVLDRQWATWQNDSIPIWLAGRNSSDSGMFNITLGPGVSEPALGQGAIVQQLS